MEKYDPKVEKDSFMTCIHRNYYEFRCISSRFCIIFSYFWFVLRWSLFACRFRHLCFVDNWFYFIFSFNFVSNLLYFASYSVLEIRFKFTVFRLIFNFKFASNLLYFASYPISISFQIELILSWTQWGKLVKSIHTHTHTHTQCIHWIVTFLSILILFCLYAVSAILVRASTNLATNSCIHVVHLSHMHEDVGCASTY